MLSMALIHQHEFEKEINCPADKFFCLFKDDMVNLPNIMPGTFKDAQVLEGDGKSVGTVRAWTYVVGDDVLVLKEKLEALDEENRTITFTILEGDLLTDYESFSVTLSVTPLGEGSLVKWCLDFEKKHEDSPIPHSHVDLMGLVSNHLDALLHMP